MELERLSALVYQKIFDKLSTHKKKKAASNVFRVTKITQMFNKKTFQTKSDFSLFMGAQKAQLCNEIIKRVTTDKQFYYNAAKDTLALTPPPDSTTLGNERTFVIFLIFKNVQLPTNKFPRQIKQQTQYREITSQRTQIKLNHHHNNTMTTCYLCSNYTD